MHFTEMNSAKRETSRKCEKTHLRLKAILQRTALRMLHASVTSITRRNSEILKHYLGGSFISSSLQLRMQTIDVVSVQSSRKLQVTTKQAAAGDGHDE